MCGYLCVCVVVSYDSAQPLNDLWEFTLREVLHESEVKAMGNFPVDAGTGTRILSTRWGCVCVGVSFGGKLCVPCVFGVGEAVCVLVYVGGFWWKAVLMHPCVLNLCARGCVVICV